MPPERKEGDLMALFCASEGAALCGGRLYGPDIKISRGWKCDSREINPGDGFVALKGAATDGHLYLHQAIERGAKLLLAEAAELERLNIRGEAYSGVSFIAVADTQRALASLAEEYLRRVSPRVAAITGSVGKTTTRELTAAALKKRFRVHSAIRSFNTLVGCSLTILAMAEDTEVLVLELGTNHFGEIEEMVSHFPPEIAVITEVAPCHLEGFGSLEGVLRAKLEICGSPRLAAVVFNNDSGLLKNYMSYNFDNIKKIAVGSGEGASLKIKEAEVRLDENGPRTSAVLCREGKDISLSCSLFGMQHAYNMGYAFAVASWLGLSDEEAAAGIAEISPISGRGLCKRSASRGWVIDEAYNANPASMSAAIRNTRAAAESLGVRKWAILAGMRELGESAAEWHRRIIGELADFDGVMLLGEEWRGCGPLPEGAALFSSLEELISKIDYNDLNDKMILVKGSNSYGLKRVVGALTEA